MFRTNCESFCNMILFDIPHSTQAPYTVRCLRGIDEASKKNYHKRSLFYGKFIVNIHTIILCYSTFSCAGLFNCLGGLFCCCKENQSLQDQLEKRLRPENSEY